MELYNICERLIAKGKTNGMAKKLDIFYAANKLTDDQYTEFTELLAEAEKEAAGNGN